jgi:hypothetical protein
LAKINSIQPTFRLFSSDPICGYWGYDMDFDDYLREEALKYRKLAEQADDPVIKHELL